MTLDDCDHEHCVALRAEIDAAWKAQEDMHTEIKRLRRTVAQLDNTVINLRNTPVA